MRSGGMACDFVFGPRLLSFCFFIVSTLSQANLSEHED